MNRSLRELSGLPEELRRLAAAYASVGRCSETREVARRVYSDFDLERRRRRARGWASDQPGDVLGVLFRRITKERDALQGALLQGVIRVLEEIAFGPRGSFHLEWLDQQIAARSKSRFQRARWQNIRRQAAAASSRRHRPEGSVAEQLRHLADAMEQRTGSGSTSGREMVRQADAAKLCGVPPHKIHRLVKAKHVRSEREGRQVFVHLRDVQERLALEDEERVESDAKVRALMREAGLDA